MPQLVFVPRANRIMLPKHTNTKDQIVTWGFRGL